MSQDTPSNAALAGLPRSITAGRAGFQPRYVKDRLARYVVMIGGLGVIVALLLIFIYLLSEVLPLFSGANVETRNRYAVPGDASATLYLAAEEQGEVGMRAAASGQIQFFDLQTGAPGRVEALPIGERKLVEVSNVVVERGLLAATLDDGSVLMFSHDYQVSYPDDRRLITPRVQYPRGTQPIAFMPTPPQVFAAREDDERLLLAGADAAGRIYLKLFEQEASLFGDSTLTESELVSFTPAVKPDLLLLEPLLNWLFVIERETGAIAFYRLDGASPPELIELQKSGAAITGARYLAGGISIVVSQADGRVTQWFPARREDGSPYLARVRDFEVRGGHAVTALGTEQRRRGFAVGDASGKVTLFYATSGARVHEEQIFDAPVERIAFNPRAKRMLVLSSSGELHVSEVHNEHPEISFSALWNKVWYESYDEPKFLWQSSSASSDFEPKFSLTPLALGTIKGAFYAMIFAIPIAVLGAIFTANFMSPEMRQVVKPAVEVLAALPSVILGFLAGLWLAPFVETNLPGVFLVLLLLPLSIPLFGYLWTLMPRAVRLRVPAGWEAAMLIPVIVLVGWMCFFIAQPIEALFFGGNMQSWMDQTLGISYIQRNALVVGIAMGIAVIPVIFSIAEDAIFSVPKHLSLGSLALGATPWQTLVGVVLPTASPGIFSAVMIGMGRAVGETMIVLMATGNTAVMDFSLFSGMRTLAANVAVEMPESEVGSTHFRLLFLAGLVLFVFTFFLNTLAEVVRSRLRQKYSNL